MFDGASLTLWRNLFPNHGKVFATACCDYFISSRPALFIIFSHDDCIYGCSLVDEKIVGLGYGIGEAVAQGFKKEITSKLSLYTGDQSDARFLQMMKADLGHEPFDIIVDDGSHVPWHQLFTFEIMFETWLKPGGLYIIEDIETSYMDGTNPRIYGYDIINAGLGKKGSAVEKFKVRAMTAANNKSSLFIFFCSG